MKTTGKCWLRMPFIIFLFMLLPTLSLGDPGDQYCITPPFITAGIKPNLLLMIDNSGSMYDLAFDDAGLKHCSNSASTCVKDADCASGGTCTVFDREPNYCYDETYSSTKTYVGYFSRLQSDGVSTQYYSYDFTNSIFSPVSSYSCVPGSGETAKQITIPTNQLCIIFNTALTTGSQVTKFLATGNYLNWLSASKFDIEKQVLTGGKYVTKLCSNDITKACTADTDCASGGTCGAVASPFLMPESRGCAGQEYIKDANTEDYVNFAATGTDTNVPLGLTFTVTGPQNKFNSSTPSPGGQTYLKIFSGTSGTTYNYYACQQAVTAISSGTNADIKKWVDLCLGTNSKPGYCQLTKAPTLDPTWTGAPVSCGSSTECARDMTNALTAKVCSLGTNITCPTLGATTGCVLAAGNFCSGKSSLACTGSSDTTTCKVTTPAVTGKCTSNLISYFKKGTTTPPEKVANLGSIPGSACTTDSACSKGDWTAQAGACEGYSAAYTTDYGPCTAQAGGDYGTCVSNNIGPCVLPGNAAAVKTNVVFQQSLQECWSIRPAASQTGPKYGFSNMNTVKQQCPDIYASYKACSNNTLQQCTNVGTQDVCGAGNTCLEGPDAIGPGNPALLCGKQYVGKCFYKSGSQWLEKSTCEDFLDDPANGLSYQEWTYCKDSVATTPVVVDPTNPPSDTTLAGNLPPILSGISVSSQMGSALATIPVRVSKSTEPTGLLQQFGNNIRIGAMSFNPFGSAFEVTSGLITAPKVCSNDGRIVCTSPTDCGSGTNQCDPVTNLDGGSILYPIGYGYCATMTGAPCVSSSDCSGANVCLAGFCGTKSSTVCTTVNKCSGSNQACISNSMGAHTTSGTLVNILDGIRASTWTPFSEAFYSAIGYFARIDSGVSRTTLRLNSINTISKDFTSFSTAPVDFNEVLNPSEYRCQQNYILLISDGSSTADRNDTVNKLATLYASQAGVTQTTCTSPTDYGGNNNLPIMAWIAKNRRISDFSLSVTASTTAPTTARDSITSYVVFNGESNGASGDCGSLTLLTKTADKGGTTIKQANDPASLATALTSVFQDVAAKAASGTAASILSNSEGSGANILQAVFYPKKIFENSTSVNWIGEMQNLWYYVDPLINNSTIREDTIFDKRLNLFDDYVVQFVFDNSSDKTMVQRYQDTNGDGSGDTAVGGLIDPDIVQSLWRAGELLWARTLPRTLKTSINGTSLVDFSSSSFPGGSVADNSTALAPYLNVAIADAPKLINYVHGQEQDGYRSRTVDIKDPVTNAISSGVWRLGDIISSTPRVQSSVRLGTYNLPAPGGYKDNSYLTFVNSNEYQSHGMVYVGANDGMLHAFKLGKLSVKATGAEKASLGETNLGNEEWAFIPKNFLPYLKYLADPNYQHLYAIDGRTLLLDASIGDTNSTGCNKDSYWDCQKLTTQSVVTSANNLDPAKNTWRTVVIGGMGLGGASAKTCTAGTNCVQTPITDPGDTSTNPGLGYSSYFALDVTYQDNPVLLWEFNNPALGYATSGPAIVRVGDSQKNGRWFAVFGSGPTGPIDTSTHQFQGRSSQTLKFFVVDLRTGELVKTIDTNITEAFSGSMIGGAIDADRWDPTRTGNYKDDAIYVGYVKKATSGTYAGTWTDGGVIRIMTKESLNPNDSTNPWSWSTVIDGIGPVTTAIARLQDKKNRNLWLFSGTGRYFYRDSAGLDDYNGARMLFGIKEPCYNKGNIGNYLDKTCTDTITGSLVDQTSSISSLSSGNNGWKINLDAATTSQGAERVVTDTVALTNGTVFFTSFKPTMDVCGYGGDSLLWGVKYDTGGEAPASALKGKALIQLSTGEFKEVDLSGAFTDKLNRRMLTPMTGKPPSDAPPVVSSSTNRPLKKILHIQEH